MCMTVLRMFCWCVSKYSTHPTELELLTTFQLGDNKERLYAEFKRWHGVTPMQKMAQLRIEQMKNLVESTRLSMTEIALQLGYPDLKTMEREFLEAQQTSLNFYND